MLDTKTPTAPLFRLGRKPDPWNPPDWSRALSDGTFGNRFDDPQGNYRVLYAATQRVSCFVETLARFRLDFSLIAELQAIAGQDDYGAAGYRAKRLVRTARHRRGYSHGSICRPLWRQPGEPSTSGAGRRLHRTGSRSGRFRASARRATASHAACLAESE